ncbi:MAG TPA: hypothetical protein VF545_12700 [Thermoleophilaceae bacterium]
MRTLRTRRRQRPPRRRGADAQRAPGRASDLPPSLADPQAVVAGAVVATLLAHSRDWVERRTETIAPEGGGAVRRSVAVDFELPGIAWASAPRGTPVLVPLGLLDKNLDAESADPRDEAGEPVVALGRNETAEVLAAGLLAIAQGAGAAVDDDVRRLVWRVVAGSPEDAGAALDEIAGGGSEAVSRAWAHEPFRTLAQTLAGQLPVLVSLRDADRRRVLRYSYEERPGAAREPLRIRSLGDRIARWLGWREARVWCAVPNLGDAASHRFEVEPGPDLEASCQLMAATPGGGSVASGPAGFLPHVRLTVDAAPRGTRGLLALRIRAGRVDLLRAEPFVGLLLALLLTGTWLALPIVGGSGRNAFALVVAAPSILAAYLGRPWGHPVLRALLRGARSIAIAVGVLSFAVAVTLASGASTNTLRVVVGDAGALAWAATWLLFETRRRVTGVPILTSPLPRTRTERGAAVEPARPLTAGVNAARAAALALAIAIGLLVVALADDAARDGRGGAYTLFWVGVLAIFVPALVHALRVRSRREAVIGVVLLGVGLYLVKVLHSPTHFTFHDEFSTLRTTVDIERFGRPFEHNPLIPVHPFYPALELVTSAISTVTGLSIFTSGLLLIGVLRVALMVGLFLVFEAAASARVAAVATIVYASNPNFVFFDSQWAYESFALPLAVVALAMTARSRPDPRRPDARMRRTAWLTLPIVITITVAHPLTSLALVLFLAVWAGIDAWTARRTGGRRRDDLWILAAAGGAFLAVWVTLVAQKTGGYIGPVLREAGGSLVDLVLGQSGAKRIFEAAGVPRTPIPEQLLGFAAVAIALAAVAFGTRALWRRFEPLAATIALAGLVYPITLPLRLTEEGTEISNRASEFVFIGIAFLAAIVALEGGARLPRRLARPRLAVPAVVAAASVLFLGGIVIGWARYARLPGDYLVIGDPRSVEPEGMAAARWSRDQLGIGNRVVADRANGLLWGSLGLQEPQGGEILGRNVPRTITAPAVDADVRYALVKDDLRYLVVDRRLSRALPAVGVYFERDEPGAYRHRFAPSLQALLKYDRVCPVGRPLDSGNLVVYDTRRAGEQYRCDTGPVLVAPGTPRLGGAGPDAPPAGPAGGPGGAGP